MLRSLRHSPHAQIKGHLNTDHLEERGTERCSAQWLSFKGRYRTIVNEINIRTVSKAMLLFFDEMIKYSRALKPGETSKRWSWACSHHPELNWTQLAKLNTAILFWFHEWNNFLCLRSGTYLTASHKTDPLFTEKKQETLHMSALPFRFMLVHLACMNWGQAQSTHKGVN